MSPVIDVVSINAQQQGSKCPSDGNRLVQISVLVERHSQALTVSPSRGSPQGQRICSYQLLSHTVETQRSS